MATIIFKDSSLIDIKYYDLAYNLILKQGKGKRETCQFRIEVWVKYKQWDIY